MKPEDYRAIWRKSCQRSSCRVKVFDLLAGPKLYRLQHKRQPSLKAFCGDALFFIAGVHVNFRYERHKREEKSTSSLLQEDSMGNKPHLRLFITMFTHTAMFQLWILLLRQYFVYCLWMSRRLDHTFHILF